ncbi:hypothetical protein [Shinella pollutisoli]|uniref:Uncharacterized protein n=1 Tax=Shinella pollutisoli TaxID=2250594 RepID=A0ABV7DJW9_9HYPH|nr:hypothetical protein [Shinella pollutisoli]
MASFGLIVAAAAAALALHEAAATLGRRRRRRAFRRLSAQIRRCAETSPIPTAPEAPVQGD